MSDEHNIRQEVLEALQREKPQYFRDGPVTEAAVEIATRLIVEEREASKSTMLTYIAGAEAEKRELLQRIAELEALRTL